MSKTKENRVKFIMDRVEILEKNENKLKYILDNILPAAINKQYSMIQDLQKENIELKKKIEIISNILKIKNDENKLYDAINDLVEDKPLEFNQEKYEEWKKSNISNDTI